MCASKLDTQMRSKYRITFLLVTCLIGSVVKTTVQSPGQTVKQKYEENISTVTSTFSRFTLTKVKIDCLAISFEDA